ncbi:uncharacterized protein LOC132261395 [Phlebotomus argentipes]|uniref:uncharacterized protein LOC132261395 n=1 Tax=Phlebotomus argentipes TaxID=94469 RepID=UPI0028936C91|nr:uncharacterized protein LOC132261395 [Phlebotomus argentipes]
MAQKCAISQNHIEVLLEGDKEALVTEQAEGDSLNERFVDLELKLMEVIAANRDPNVHPPTQQDTGQGDNIATVLSKQTELMSKLFEVQRQGSAGTPGGSRTKLPQLKLPSFDGKYTDWPHFRDAFESAIHDNDELMPNQKMQYLKMSLSGSAAEDVSHISISNENYEATWDRLKKRYGKKVHLVNAYIEQFMAQTQTKVENASDLQAANRKYRQIIDGLKALGEDCLSLDMWLIYLMKSNMSVKFRMKWEGGRSSDALCKLDDFFDFLTEETDIMERASQSFKLTSTEQKTSEQKTSNKQGKPGIKSHHTNASKCPECNSNHPLHLCDKFKSLTLFEKRERMGIHHLCYNCMRTGHSVAKCQSKTSCQKCGKRHHTLLHSPKMDPEPEEVAPSVPNAAPKASTSVVSQTTNETQQTESGQPSTITTHHSAINRKALLPTAVVDIRDVHGNLQACRVLIDGGGECTLVAEACAQRLGLPRTRAKIAVQGAGEVKVGFTKGMIVMELSSRYEPQNKIKVEAYVFEKVTSMLPSTDISASKWKHLECLQLADPHYKIPGKIDLILGAEYAMAINLPQILKGEPGEPVAQLTIFGWVVGGPISGPLNSITSLHTRCEDLDDLLKRFWEVDNSNLEKKPILTAEESACEEHFTKTHTRDDTGRYVVKLPFKEEHKPLGNSTTTALARFQSLERRLAKDPSLREQYEAFMAEYLSLRHMEPVIDRDPKPDDQVYYLPHQAVLRLSSETTKLRVVFDASATTRPSKPSLNDVLAIGPTRQEDLLVLLLRFRTYQVAMTADVEKMYRQIRVAEEDTDFQRIYWRSNPQEQLRSFRLLTVTYGTSCAPFLAVRVLHQIAHDYMKEYPEACRAILTSFYMDDLLCGAESVEQGKRLQAEIQEVLRKGHFSLRKWASNSCEVLEDIQPEMRAISPDEVMSESKAISALGLKWRPGKDEFSLVLEELPPARTKRDLCAATAKVFDPLGFISPVVINLKMMFQALWLASLEWDDQLPVEIAEAYNQVQAEFHVIQDVRVPRGLPSESNIMEIHGFSDASERAYGAVVYVKGVDSSGNTKISIVIAKSRVAPLKPITIPRLELNAALLLAHLIAKVKEAVTDKQMKIYAWSDSTIVLQWLQESPRTWNTFVAHRVCAIQEILAPANWRHVPTASNPADCISRGVSPKELLDHHLWWHGPPWLGDSEEKWPENKTAKGKTGEERSSHATSLMTQIDADPLTHLLEVTSGYLRIIRFVAYWIKFFKNRRVEKKERQAGFLTVKELEEAKIRILRHIQRKAFPIEYKSCGRGEPLLKSSKLLKLAPFLDKDGLLRVQGRLANAEMSYATQHPIILPSDHKFVREMIIFTHEMNLHAGASILMTALRTRYWILGLRSLAKGITRKCVRCIKARPTTETPFMGDLPAARVQQHRAFYQSGCDFAGPIKIRASKLRKAPIIKAYIAVFICMSTKAMHLEAVSDLTTDAFLAAQRRFSARRGHCHSIFCDNGTNFLGASGTTRAERLQGVRAHRDRVTSEMAGNGTEFHFIPSYSPTFGGLWERGVSNVKRHLRRAVGEYILTFEELSTVLAQIEACLNSRPLCAKSSDMEDLDPLTPGHFLVGHALNLTPDPDLLSSNPNRLSRWILLQRMVQDFWRRWQQKYVTTLQHRPKWYKKTRNLCVGDLVLLRDNTFKPTFWSMGRVLEIHPGRDEVVRVVTVKTQDGVQKRAVNTLAWLPLDPFLSPSRTQGGENVENIGLGVQPGVDQ